MGPSQVYRTSLALLTDFYQLTMAAAAWKGGVAAKEAVFHLSFRRNPFEGGYAVAAGLEDAVDLALHARFTADDLSFLAAQRGGDGAPLFEPAFLDWLEAMELDVDVDAVPEGTVVFPHEPLLRVRGPVVPCMLLETPLLAIVNFQTLVATKAARIVLAARGQPVIEFGLRRAQGIDGALSAARAAYVGGVAGTSNVLAGKLLGIPVKGTHAHSWVLLFDDEREAFLAYARAMPGNTVLLVDTYDTLEGVRHAVEVGRWLASEGHRLAGIRLDSGDLAWLSQRARTLLDEAGLHETVILASNELDEHVIHALHDQRAAVAVWGVGTRLVTAWGEPALGGVYKLSAVRDGPGKPWVHRVKLSEQLAKTTVPGIQQVRRYRHPDGAAGVHPGGFLADVIFDEELGLPPAPEMIDPLDFTRRRVIPEGTPFEDLLVPVLRRGKPAWTPPPLAEIRTRAAAQLARLHDGAKRLVHPHAYPVGLERGLHDLRTRLVLEARHRARRAP